MHGKNAGGQAEIKWGNAFTYSLKGKPGWPLSGTKKADITEITIKHFFGEHQGGGVKLL